MIASKSLYVSAAVASGAVGVAAPEFHALRALGQVMEAFGIYLPGPVYVAGLAFAVAAAFIALSHTLPEDRMDKWATLSAACLIATAAAIVQGWAGRHMHPSIDEFPPQLFMGLAGLTSRKIVDWGWSPDTILGMVIKQFVGGLSALIGGRK